MDLVHLHSKKTTMLKNKEQFEVAVFDNFDDSNCDVIEGGLSYADALKMATQLWESGKYYGVEIIDQNPENMEPIVWVESKYNEEDDDFIDPAGGRGLHSHV